MPGFFNLKTDILFCAVRDLFSRIHCAQVCFDTRVRVVHRKVVYIIITIFVISLFVQSSVFFTVFKIFVSF
jgi:hypothetical protein